MLTIGLTGGIGSGKSTAARYFTELGVTVIHADAIAREIVAPNSAPLNQIIAHFGPNIVDEQGNLCRDKLRGLIFSNPKERQWLENLLHPIILKRMHQLAKKANSAYCIMEIPLLLEKNVPVDRILVIDVPVNLQILRLQQRTKMDETEIKDILETQLQREQRLAKADDIIHNEGGLAALKQQVQSLHQKYLQLCKKNNGREC